MKTYSSKSNAKRGALTRYSKLDVMVNAADLVYKEIDGKWLALDTNDAQLFDHYGYVECPHCGIELGNGVICNGDEDGEGNTIKLEKEYECMACGGQFGDDVAPAKPATKRGPVNERSTISNPCKVVWDIAERMFAENPETRRKDVIAECQKAGIAFYTARTQYQLWRTAVREQAANAANVSEV